MTSACPLPLRDLHGRLISYLRISVTTQCNLHCAYCTAQAAPPAPDPTLTFDQIVRVARVAATLGVTKIKLTGGEPLLRDGLPDLVARLARIPGIRDLSLTTNGHLLTALALALKTAGLQRVTVALDTLDPAVYRDLTGGELQPALDGIQAARRVFSDVRINSVVMAGINDHEICALADYCVLHDCALRFLEVMPTVTGDCKRHFMSNELVFRRLAEQFVLKPCPPSCEPSTAYWYSVDGGSGRIGFISPLSRPFCATCNRLRLTASGELIPCLHAVARVSVRDLFDRSADDAALADALRRAAAQKPATHTLNTTPSPCNMLCTGG